MRYRVDNRVYKLILFRSYASKLTITPTAKAVDENKDVYDDFRDGNESFKDPGRRGRRRSEEPWFWHLLK